MLTYTLPGNHQELILTDQVIAFLGCFRQQSRNQTEAGGQLFAKITEESIVVETATGPHNKDLRRRFYFFPSQIRLRAEIKSYFKKGLHYVGDWHTHPQKLPLPSSLDIDSMKRCFRKSKHELEHFILIIVGQKSENENIWVGLVSEKSCINIGRYVIKKGSPYSADQGAPF